MGFQQLETELFSFVISLETVHHRSHSIYFWSKNKNILSHQLSHYIKHSSPSSQNRFSILPICFCNDKIKTPHNLYHYSVTQMSPILFALTELFYLSIYITLWLNKCSLIQSHSFTSISLEFYKVYSRSNKWAFQLLNVIKHLYIIWGTHIKIFKYIYYLSLTNICCLIEMSKKRRQYNWFDLLPKETSGLYSTINLNFYCMSKSYTFNVAHLMHPTGKIISGLMRATLSSARIILREIYIILFHDTFFTLLKQTHTIFRIPSLLL